MHPFNAVIFLPTAFGANQQMMHHCKPMMPSSSPSEALLTVSDQTVAVGRQLSVLLML
jgi:hypothetical protein